MKLLKNLFRKKPSVCIRTRVYNPDNFMIGTITDIKQSGEHGECHMYTIHWDTDNSNISSLVTYEDNINHLCVLKS